jgi:hypothetical protein
MKRKYSSSVKLRLTIYGYVIRVLRLWLAVWMREGRRERKNYSYISRYILYQLCVCAVMFLLFFFHKCSFRRLCVDIVVDTR